MPPIPVSGGGSIGISPVDTSMSRCIGAGWASWSHGYTGDVYYNGGGTSQTLTLPAGTGAVYFYVEPNPMSLQQFEAVAQPGGVSTGLFEVDGNGGARYVGFYTTGGDTIQSITITANSDFAVGEFGWAGGEPSPITCDNVLIYDDNTDDQKALQAADNLGLAYTRAASSDFVTLLTGGGWDLVIFDCPSTYPNGDWQTALMDYVAGGGRLIMSYWTLQTESAAFQSAMGVSVATSLSIPLPLYGWGSHEIFDGVPNMTIGLDDAWFDDGDKLNTVGDGVAAGGYTMTPAAAEAAVVIANGKRTIYNGLLFDSYDGDQDTDGTLDIIELIENQIEFLCDSETVGCVESLVGDKDGFGVGCPIQSGLHFLDYGAYWGDYREVDDPAFTDYWYTGDKSWTHSYTLPPDATSAAIEVFLAGVADIGGNASLLVNGQVVAVIPYEADWSDVTRLVKADVPLGLLTGQNQAMVSLVEQGDGYIIDYSLLKVCGDELDDCVENDSGQLDIAGSSGAPGGSTTVRARIQGAPSAVGSLGFEVKFDPAVFNYTDFVRGDLVADFDFFDCNIPAGETDIVRCGGFKSTGGISAGASGEVVSLAFDVAQRPTIDCDLKYKFGLQALKDDIAGWSATHGCFECGCDCDVNGDGEVTPQDALCAFQKYLGICPTACGPCEDICCDVTVDDDCTPADALEIFKEYLGLPSVCSEVVEWDCIAPPFNPEKWNDGGTVQYNNNCYNFANDTITGTFAQPGRRCGDMYASLTCPEVADGAVCDGLPSSDRFAACPDGMHKVFLAVWPGTDYHWYRQDLPDGMWSHKPGSTPARDYDQSGMPISNPETADRGGYTDACGYFCACGDNADIQ
jgi:hypothetical protein